MAHTQEEKRRRRALSLFALIQVMALFQALLLAFAIVPAIWLSGESVVTCGLPDHAVNAFERWFAQNMHSTRWWVAGVGGTIFLIATIGSMSLYYAKKRRSVPQDIE